MPRGRTHPTDPNSLKAGNEQGPPPGRSPRQRLHLSLDSGEEAVVRSVRFAVRTDGGPTGCRPVRDRTGRPAQPGCSQVVPMTSCRDLVRCGQLASSSGSSASLLARRRSSIRCCGSEPSVVAMSKNSWRHAAGSPGASGAEPAAHSAPAQSSVGPGRAVGRRVRETDVRLCSSNTPRSSNSAPTAAEGRVQQQGDVVVTEGAVRQLAVEVSKAHRSPRCARPRTRRGGWAAGAS